MKVAIIGGSNSIITDSYVQILSETIDVTNFGIGAVNSIYGLIQILKYDIIENHDLLIFEYFVNDNNHYFIGINNVDRVQKTLIEITKMCILAKKKLLFIFIYNKGSQLNNKYDESEMYKMYINFVKKYKIPFIDVYNLLYSIHGDNWSNFYRDPTHLSVNGMSILANKVINKINKAKPLKFLECNYEGFDKIHFIKIDEYVETDNFTNSLISMNYFTVTNQIKIKFTTDTILLAIEYICDNGSGYIEINNGKQKIQKNTLKNESLVLVKNKMMASLITFNNLIFSESREYTIDIISSDKIDKTLIDRERVCCDRVSDENNFKIVSLLVTNNSSIYEIE